MKSDRHAARLLAVQGLYMHQESKDCSRDFLLQFPWIHDQERSSYAQENQDFARLLIMGTLEHINDIDNHIKQRLRRWDISRISRVDLSILRISFFCLIYQHDIPPAVTIQEAVLLSQELSGDRSYTFINGILDNYVKDRNKEDGPAQE